jgi:hypothetical protein
MAAHEFWGKVEADWAGFSAEHTYIIPHFGNKEIEVFLGEEYDDDGDEIETPPSQEQLDRYKITFLNFINNMDTVISEIKEKAFARYLGVYAHFYEDKTKSGEEPLNIDSSEKHFQFMKEINLIRVLDGDVIKIPIHYELDTEHGLEIKLRNNRVVEVGGIAET